MTVKCPVCGSTSIQCGLNLEIRPHRDGIGKTCKAAGLPFATTREGLA